MSEPAYFEAGGCRYCAPYFGTFSKLCVVESQKLLDFIVQGLRGPNPCTLYHDDEAYWRPKVMEGLATINDETVTDPWYVPLARLLRLKAGTVTGCAYGAGTLVAPPWVCAALSKPVGNLL